jgi:hypothetical protein
MGNGSPEEHRLMMGRGLWCQFTVGIAALILAGLGVFLLLERMQIGLPSSAFSEAFSCL